MVSGCLHTSSPKHRISLSKYLLTEKVPERKIEREKDLKWQYLNADFQNRNDDRLEFRTWFLGRGLITNSATVCWDYKCITQRSAELHQFFLFLLLVSRDQVSL